MRKIRLLTPKFVLKFYLQRVFSSKSSWIAPTKGFDTGIRVYNCAAQRQVPLILKNESYVTWYTCGPTVYDATHLGHASCYVKLDIIQRILRDYFNLNLVTAMNITDIDDKIITKSIESNNDWRELTKFYEAQFWADMRKLNILEPTFKLRVTDYVADIIMFIDCILKKRLAYRSNDGSIYFDVNKYPMYGKLQKINLKANIVELKQTISYNAAVEVEKTRDKNNEEDFALWKAKKFEKEPSWKSPWGDGRPGWHIECSSLASKIFGDNIDVHAGGIDLKFPHHENEEAQSCVFHNSAQWVNYWLHTGHLIVKGQSEKMSKSLQNTITVDELLQKYTADDFRMACLLSNYKNDMEYSSELMDSAHNTLNKFKSFHHDCMAYLEGKKDGGLLDAPIIRQNLINTKTQVDLSLKEDFDTARVLRILLNQTNSISRCLTAAGDEIKTASSLDAIAAVDNYIQWILSLLGLQYANNTIQSHAHNTDENAKWNRLIDGIIQTRQLIRQRAVAGKDKDLFEVCDELRNCLKEHGIVIRDHRHGTTWEFIMK